MIEKENQNQRRPFPKALIQGKISNKPNKKNKLSSIQR
jgi:hypothetical protein